jgi:hypothetical protein
MCGQVISACLCMSPYSSDYPIILFRGAPSLVVTPSLSGLARDCLIAEVSPEFTEFVQRAYALRDAEVAANILKVNGTITPTMFWV